jgi:hypothetical protein
MLFCINDDQDLTTLTVDGLFYGHSCFAVTRRSLTVMSS